MEQPDLVLMPLLQKLRPKVPNVYMAVLETKVVRLQHLKKRMTIGYVKESDYMDKHPL